MKSLLPIRRLLIPLFVVVFYLPVWAQTDFEEWKKQRQQQMQDFKTEREAQLADLAKKFDDYVQEQDKAFADYLAERWRQFQAFQGIALPEEPKPDVIPVFEEPDRSEAPKPLPNIKIPPRIEPESKPTPILPRPVRQEPESFPVNIAEVFFYGNNLSIEYDKSFKTSVKSPVNEESISSFFEQMSQTNYNSFLDQLYAYRDQMNLNDWGYYTLIQQTASNIAGRDENTARLLTWFLMLKSGYKVKAAYFEDVAYLLLPVVNQVYSRNFFVFDNQKYYLMDGDVSQLYTYEKDFPDARRVFDLNLYRVLAFGDQLTDKPVNFNYMGESYRIDVRYNNHVIDFYRDYPQSDIKIYFDAMVSNELKTSLVESFAPAIEGKSEYEAVSLLLRFVQTNFSYQTDQDQFGYEKFFFADEVFHYPYSDCEDRSVLFAYLVRSLLGLEVIGLNFPGHIATAVHFNEEVEGDFIPFDGKKFIVADPTYINAPVGLTMPDYVGQEAEIVVLGNIYGSGKYRRELWDELIASGAGRGDTRSDIAVDDKGQTLVTGYFSEGLTFKGISESANGNPSMFSMLLSETGKPLWFARSAGAGKAIAYSVTFNRYGDALVTGTFSGEMTIGRFRINSDEGNDIFVASFDKNGNVNWLSKAGLTEVNQDNFLTFLSRFSNSGKHLGNELYFDSGVNDNFGIFAADDEIYVAGAFNRNTGMNMMETTYASGGNFSVLDQLKEENDKLIAQNYEKTIAGLFAAVHLIGGSNVSIPGKDVQQLFDRYNPSFKKEFPKIYNIIGSILFIKNQDGIVTIRTSDSKGITIDMMKVAHDARIKVVILESGDAKLEILSGVTVGKAMWWYDLNYILLYRQNGNLLFDYDTDNAQAMKNLRKDLLY